MVVLNGLHVQVVTRHAAGGVSAHLITHRRDAVPVAAQDEATASRQECHRGLPEEPLPLITLARCISVDQGAFNAFELEVQALQSSLAVTLVIRHVGDRHAGLEQDSNTAGRRSVVMPI
jgi:hypothetical protein